MEDAIVCGGGPAGLAAATWLGRYRRMTTLVDAGAQRNLAADASHGYLSRDGCSPTEIIDAARRDLDRYESVNAIIGTAEAIRRDGDDFVVTVETEEHRAHRVFFATGVEDVFPDIPGFQDLYGSSVFHCSCCDGYEACDRNVIAIGWGEHSAGYALDLLEWGASVTLVTNGEEFEGDESSRLALDRNEIEIVEERVLELCQHEGRMTGARLESGLTVEGEMAFFSIAHRPRIALPQAIGCEIDDEGYVTVDDHGQTSVAGAYAAGDITPGEQLVQVAASEGAVAGIACAMSLRGTHSASAGQSPGPDPEKELATSRDRARARSRR